MERDISREAKIDKKSAKFDNNRGGGGGEFWGEGVV